MPHSWLKKFAMHNVLFALCMAFLLILPDFAFSLYRFKALIIWEHWGAYWGCIFLIALALSLSPQRWFAVSFLAILSFVQLLEFSYTSYFGLPIAPEIIGHFFSNTSEDAQEIARMGFGLDYIIVAMVALSFVCLCMLVKRFHVKTAHNAAGYILLTAVFIFAGHNITSAHTRHMPYPRITAYSINNFVTAATLYAFRSDTLISSHSAWQPYQITPLPTHARNIILILGESCRPDYMSLYGKKEDTTPLLKTLAHDPHFLFRPMISSSVSTFTSISYLMNLIREPGNLPPLSAKAQNLFTMAKNNGFKTAWIGTQSANNLTYAGIEKADLLVTQDSDGLRPERDDRLLDILRGYQLGANNFIVLHQRNLHAPYAENYAHHPELQLFSNDDIARTQDSDARQQKQYMNAMRYNDYTVSNLISYLKEQLKDKGESYIFYVADHGELLADEVDGHKLYGHTMLNMQVAQVPFIMFSVNPDPAFVRRISSMPSLTHYDLGLLMADRLGYNVANPNAKPGDYYLLSADIHDADRYISYHLDNTGSIDSAKLSQVK